MTILHQGREVDPRKPGIEEASETVCLSIHGLMELESVWRLSASGEQTYATGLSDRIPGGVTDMMLRYNTGRPIYRNGEDLAALLETLVDAWPVPVKRLILLGHSMGGLLIRSTCHYGRVAGHRWAELLGDCVYIGSPHDGSWLARGAHAAAGLLNDMPRDYLRVVGEVIDLRSEGIRNLTRGEVLARGVEETPLMPGVRHFVVCGLLARYRKNPVNALFGDALVHESSAQGRERSGWELAGIATFSGVDHIRLAHHPEVAKQLEAWLV